MRQSILHHVTTAALAVSLTLLAVVGVAWQTGRLRIVGDDPMGLAIKPDGAMLAVIYPAGDAGDVEALHDAVARDNGKGGR